MARVLIIGGGCRGRRLAGELVGEGHAVRITTRTERGREAVEASGAECWIGTPDRLATLRGALEGVTIACWLLACASGDPEQVQPLFGSRLDLFVRQAIDTTVRGLVYEGSGPAEGAGHAGWSGPAAEQHHELVAPEARGLPAAMLAGGERIIRRLTAHNAIPLAVLRADPSDPDAWLADARAALARLLGG